MLATPPTQTRTPTSECAIFHDSVTRSPTDIPSTNHFFSLLRSLTHPLNHSFLIALSYIFRHSFSQSFFHVLWYKKFSQSINQSVNHPMELPFHRPTDQSISQISIPLTNRLVKYDRLVICSSCSTTTPKLRHFNHSPPLSPIAIPTYQLPPSLPQSLLQLIAEMPFHLLPHSVTPHTFIH